MKTITESIWKKDAVTQSETKSSTDECIAREGRPYSGCAILWKLTLRNAVRQLKCNHTSQCVHAL